jgi:hypothetical protein
MTGKCSRIRRHHSTIAPGSTMKESGQVTLVVDKSVVCKGNLRSTATSDFDPDERFTKGP